MPTNFIYFLLFEIIVENQHKTSHTDEFHADFGLRLVLMKRLTIVDFLALTQYNLRFLAVYRKN